MLRVSDLESSMDFYENQMGMSILRRQDFKDGRFTLVFLGYGAESEQTVLELTHNWDERNYDLGAGYGHISLAVTDIYDLCDALEKHGVTISRAPGPMAFDKNEVIAFIKDPDGYQIELIERN